MNSRFICFRYGLVFKKKVRNAKRTEMSFGPL
jgi:hypothetical protein